MISVMPANRPIVRMWHKRKRCDFPRHFKYDNVKLA